MSAESQIGLALGGGGARGVTHILVCEVFDELGVRPSLIAGTSIGAIIGAAYAAGVSGREMRERTCALYGRRREVLTRLWRARPVAFTDLLRGRSLSAQFDARLILDRFVPGFEHLPETFADLRIPLKIIATDFYAWHECVLSEGPLKQAIAASIAIPAVFKPVQVDGRVLIDGGACNPLPFDHIGECQLSVACDVTGGPKDVAGHSPRLMECVVGAAQISMQSVIAEKLRWKQPDILVRPEINGVFVLDFLKTELMLSANQAFKDDLKRRLDEAITTASQAASGSAPVTEKPSQQLRRRRLANAGIDLWRMVAGGRLKEANAMINAAALGIGRAVVQPANAGKGNRRRA